MRLIADSFLMFGDLETAKLKAEELRRLHPGSTDARNVLMLLQLVAMAERDSTRMNNTIALMAKEGCSPGQIHTAKTMQVAYHRVRPRARLPRESQNAHIPNASHSVPLPSESAFGLRNYPNPFNPSTMIEYTLSEEMEVQLSLYTILGDKVADLDRGLKNAGTHRVEFTAPSNLPSGLYIYELITPQGTAKGKMTLTK